MTFFTVLRIVLIFMLSLAIYFAAGDAITGDYVQGVNWFGLSTILYVLVLLLSSYVKSERIQPLIAYFIFVSIFWCVFRLIVLNNSLESVNFRYLVDFDLADMTWSVLMLTFSSGFLVCGLLLGSYRGPPKLRLNVPVISSGYISFLLFWAVIENSIFRGSGTTKLLNIISMALSLDSLILLVASLLVYKQTLPRTLRHLLVLLIICYVLMRVASGSKAAIYIVFTGALTTLLAFNYRFKLKLKHLILAVCVVPFALFFFVAGTELRAISYSLSRSGDFSYLQLMSTLYDVRHDIFGNLDVAQWFNVISRRLSMFDYLNVSFNGSTITDHLGLIYGLKTLWNIVTPSFVSFDDAILFQANLFKVAYGHGTYLEAVGNYHSDMLPLFGSTYVIFGGLSLPIIGLFGYVSSRLYILIDCCNFKEKYFFKGLFIYFFGDFLFGMGLMSTIQQILFFTLIPFVTYFVVQNIRVSWKRPSIASS